ncbi:MAG: hypothetical protein AABW63_00085 [Nanoarchaeota archaeon]
MIKKDLRGKTFFFVVISVIFISSVSAGIGIRSYQDSVLLNEGEQGCVTIGAYNPFDTGTNVIVGISDSLKEVLVSQEADSKYLPPQTSSDNAIPLKFCFKVPQIYQRDCTVGNFVCELKCSEEQKIYDGDIYLQSIPAANDGGGIAGSTTKMSVSRPLKVGVVCTPHSRDYTLAYLVLAVASGLTIFFVLFRRLRKPKVERDKEKLMKLKEAIRKESSKKKR